MSKLKYGEFSFSKPNQRPSVKGYAYGGTPTSEPAAAAQPTGARLLRPAPPAQPAPNLTPAQKLQQANQAVINKANARDGGNRLIDPKAMKAAIDRNMAIKQATDARHKEEAKRNTVQSQPMYRQDEMARMKKPTVQGAPTSQPQTSNAALAAQQQPATPMKTGGKVGLWDNIHAKQDRIKHGSGEKMRKPGSKGAPTAEDFKVSAGKMSEGGKADMAQDKVMIKKAIKQHDQQEHPGGKGTNLKLKKGGMPRVFEKKELTFLKKAGAPAKMVKHEEREMMEPMGAMKSGGAAKKGVPSYNKKPKIC